MPSQSIIRRGSTPVSTVLRKSVRFFTINIFNNKITIIELSGKQSGQMFSFSNFRALDRNPRKGTLGTLKIKKNSRGLPQTPSPSAPRLGNRSILILDPRLIIAHNESKSILFCYLQVLKEYNNYRLLVLFDIHIQTRLGLNVDFNINNDLMPGVTLYCLVTYIVASNNSSSIKSCFSITKQPFKTASEYHIWGKN